MQSDAITKREIFNLIEKGKRVWSYGYFDHGPMDGPKIDIPADIGGEIISYMRPYSTMDFFLYEVKWDSGHFSKHYYKDLEPIGICRDLTEYEKVLSTGKNAKLTTGPRRGFRKFEMIIQYNDVEYLIYLNGEQSGRWQRMSEIFKKNSINWETEILSGKQSK